MFQNLISLCRRVVGASPPTVESSADERRVWVRHPSGAETIVQPIQNGSVARLSARVRNVSRGGTNLIVNKCFNPGDMLSIELPGSDAARTSAVLACIVHVNPAGPEQWALGCTFSEELNDEDLASFGARRERPSEPENRAWKRFDCSVKAEYQLVSDVEKQTWPADVVNISAGGIGLQVARGVEMGALLSLKLQGSKGHTRNVLACVVHVIASGGDWLLGCNFIHELSEADFKALL
jgi:PilZ domain